MKNRVIVAIGIGIAAVLAPSIGAQAEELIPEKDINETTDNVDFNDDGDQLDIVDVVRDDEAIDKVEYDSIQEGTEGLDDPIWIADVDIIDNTPAYEYDNKEEADNKKEELEDQDYEVTITEREKEEITSEVETITKEEYEETPDDQKLDPIVVPITIIDTESDPIEVSKDDYDKAEDDAKLPPVTEQDIIKDFDGYQKVSEDEYVRITSLSTTEIDGEVYYFETLEDGSTVYYKAYKEELDNKSQCLIIANRGSILGHLEGEGQVGDQYYYYDEHNNLKKKKVPPVDLSNYEKIVDDYCNQEAEKIEWNTQGQYFYGEQTAVIDKGGVYEIDGTNASRLSIQTSEKVVIIITSKNDKGYVPTATTRKDFQPNQTGNKKWDFGDIFPNLTFVSKLKEVILTSNNNIGDVIAPKSKIKAKSGNFCGQLICDKIEGGAEGHTRKTEGSQYADKKIVKDTEKYYIYNTIEDEDITYQRYKTVTHYYYKVEGKKLIHTSYYGEKIKETPPVVPPETPEEPTPPGPPIIPPDYPVPPVTPPPVTPETPVTPDMPVLTPVINIAPPTLTSLPPVVTIEENEVPLAGEVLGAKRARGQVLGAKRGRGEVLGARRTPETADANGFLSWLSLFGLSGAGLGLFSKKKRGN